MLHSTMGSEVTLLKAPSNDVQHWLDRSLDKRWTIKQNETRVPNACSGTSLKHVLLSAQCSQVLN